MEKIKAFLAKYDTVFQIIKFTLASLIAFIVEFAILFALGALLKDMNNQPFDWFIFHYAGDGVNGLGTAITFFVSTVCAQIVSFIVNRKKTFGANNSLTFSIVIYIILIVALICAQTYFAPQLAGVLANKFSLGVEGANSIAKMFFCFVNWVILFPMEKFVIMKKSPEKETAAEETTAAAE